MKRRCYRYLLLISVVVSILLTVTNATDVGRGIGLPCSSALCRFAVLITINCPNNCKYLGVGSVLNENWILTAQVVVAGRKAKEENMLVIGGHNESIDKLSQYPVSKIYINDDSKEVKTSQTVALLELENSIQFSETIGEVIFAFEHAKKPLFQCQLISITVGNNKVLNKTQILVQGSFKGQSGCTTESEDLMCVQPLLKNKKKKDLVNPCTEKASIGGTLVCDLGLEGIFIGHENGKGCDPLPPLDQLRAIYFKRPTDPNTEWIENMIRPKDEGVTDFTDDLVFPTKPLDTTTTTTSTETSETTDTVSSMETSSTNTTAVTNTMTNDTDLLNSTATESGTNSTELPSILERMKKWRKPKCSSGFRHDQFFIVLCIVTCKYVI